MVLADGSMQSGREEELFPSEMEEEISSPDMEDRSISEQSTTLPEVESERTKEQIAVYEAESTLGESTSCGEIGEKSESLPLVLEGNVAQVETVGCEPEESLSFPHLEEPHQRLWRDIRNFDTLGSTVEYEGDDERDDLTKEIEPKKEEETDSRKVSAPATPSRKWLLVKLLLAGRKSTHLKFNFYQLQNLTSL